MSSRCDRTGTIALRMVLQPFINVAESLVHYWHISQSLFWIVFIFAVRTAQQHI